MGLKSKQITDAIRGFLDPAKDMEIIAAISAATFNPTATISPANGKVMYAGQEYVSGGDYYKAVADNVVLKLAPAFSSKDIVITDATKGLVQKDRGDGTYKRIVITNGVLSIESV